MTRAKQPVTPKVRCAVYTRKSTEEGLDMEFNTLDAQREACEAYIASQKGEGWFLVPDRYDDGGFSGGNLERPALKRLMADIEAGRVNVVVVYKIDRLTRSLMDFGKLVEVFDRHAVTFVSVTQSFNTTTSMGRLTLNILLSFSQFERELSAERIRDKFAMSKKKGMWMGGHPPLGYVVKERKLVIHEDEAEAVKMLFRRFAETGSVTLMVKEMEEGGVVGKYGNPLDKGAIYRILGHRVYVGEIAYHGEIYAGEHQGIIDRELWNRVHAILESNNRQRSRPTRVQTSAPLKGIIRCRHCDRAMKPTFTRKEGRLYRYYTCQNACKNGHDACPQRTVAAGEIEAVVIQQVRTMLRSPEMVVKTWQVGNNEGLGIRERDVADALRRLDPIWEELFPVEQQRLVQLLIGKVEVGKGDVKVHLRAEGLDTLARELSDIGNQKEVAA
ncbi:MAG: recombinase family protein [Magnetococcales bacterium]|nr:recombinase family protein [Magnetococcales bacterium]